MENKSLMNFETLKTLAFGTRNQLATWLRKANKKNPKLFMNQGISLKDASLEELRVELKKGISKSNEVIALPEYCDDIMSETWLKVVTWQIGLGFNLDIKISEYVQLDGNPFPSKIQKTLEASLENAKKRLGLIKCYEICLDEFHLIADSCREETC